MAPRTRAMGTADSHRWGVLGARALRNSGAEIKPNCLASTWTRARATDLLVNVVDATMCCGGRIGRVERIDLAAGDAEGRGRSLPARVISPTSASALTVLSRRFCMVASAAAAALRAGQPPAGCPACAPRESGPPGGPVLRGYEGNRQVSLPGSSRACISITAIAAPRITFARLSGVIESSLAAMSRKSCKACVDGFFEVLEVLILVPIGVRPLSEFFLQSVYVDTRGFEHRGKHRRVVDDVRLGAHVSQFLGWTFELASPFVGVSLGSASRSAWSAAWSCMRISLSRHISAFPILCCQG